MSSLIIDVMGGDHAPRVILEGVVQALPELRQKGAELILLGDEERIRPLLRKRRLRPLALALADPARAGIRVTLRATRDEIGMEDSIRAVRNRPNATLNVGCQLAAAGYREPGPSGPPAFVSAGHSGAVMAAALLHMGRIAGIERPAIAVKLPTRGPLSQGRDCVLLDAGANVDCRPEHLRDFAVMGAIYAQADRRGPGLPRVGLLANGEELGKGNELTRSALAMIERLGCFADAPGAIGRFVGYAEGKEIFKGDVDVVVTDGFVGNVVLKSLEGLGSTVVSILKTEAKSSLFVPLGLLLASNAIRRLKRRLDYAEYGAAPLLGVAGYVFICHGRSNPRAIKNALLRAHSALQDRFVERLETIANPLKRT